jgi:hypothetical protein
MRFLQRWNLWGFASSGSPMARFWSESFAIKPSFMVPYKPCRILALSWWKCGKEQGGREIAPPLAWNTARSWGPTSRLSPRRCQEARPRKSLTHEANGLPAKGRRSLPAG